ncbi:hypothetical protein GCM10028799_16840 [Kribbella italica]
MIRTHPAGGSGTGTSETRRSAAATGPGRTTARIDEATPGVAEATSGVVKPGVAKPGVEAPSALGSSFSFTGPVSATETNGNRFPAARRG